VARLKAWLSDRQKGRMTRLAREKGLTCPECGSSEPVPNDEVEAHQDGSVDVLMRCEEKECENASEMAVVLSPEEAKALGLHSLGERPEVP
jgi:RNA polymerase subunit RPABC4/transcription elongation factor Spt4